jgi:hypothetical protein
MQTGAVVLPFHPLQNERPSHPFTLLTKVLGDHIVGGVAPLGDAPILADAAVGHQGVPTVLLLSLLTALAGAAGVDNGPHTGPVSDLEFGDLLADTGDDANDLVTRDKGILGHLGEGGDKGEGGKNNGGASTGDTKYVSICPATLGVRRSDV